MINEDKLAEFLEQHKRNPENFNNEGNYDPNPYWLAEDIVNLFAIFAVEGQCYNCKVKEVVTDGYCNVCGAMQGVNLYYQSKK